MRFLADLHVHSRYSRATSRDLDLERLARWARLKGITVLGTGDFTHPAWFAELQEKLVPAEDGLFRLRDDLDAAVARELPPACRGPVRFLLQVEISNIYKQGGRVRKVHNLCYMPDFDAAARFRDALARVGNLEADGRPILGLSSRDLLETTLSASPRACLIPAHIWTPWFSALGAQSGFDSIEECYGDLASHIFAVETGLSSDPPMNWRLSALDRFALVSSSDAHSPARLGREAIAFDTELSYDALFDALRTRDPARFHGTVEFFPEEGKYHYDGHRACGVRLAPHEARAHGGLCPRCGRPVTRGVLARVEELADRPEDAKPARPAPFRRLVPLPEILAEVHDVGPGSRAVEREHARLLARLGPELELLEHAPLEEIARAGGPLLAEAVRRVRAGELRIAAGFDGEYGTVRILDPEDRHRFTLQVPALEPAEPAGQGSAPAETAAQPRPHAGAPGGRGPLLPAPAEPEPGPSAPAPGAGAAPSSPFLSLFGGDERAGPAAPPLDPDQLRAVRAGPEPLLVLAGPGTGKTRVLTHRIAHLVRRLAAPPDAILAVTFTQRAAGELAERLEPLLGPDARRVRVRTLHAFGLDVLRAHGPRIGLPPTFTVLDDDGAADLLARATGTAGAEARRLAEAIARAKERLLAPADLAGTALGEAYRSYQDALAAAHAVDYDDLIRLVVLLFREDPEAAREWRARFPWILVDEYQDVSGAQAELLRALAPTGRGLTAVGDPDQAIYGFRGADPGHALRFARDFPDAAVVRLRQNYRSTAAILRAARETLTGGRDDTARRLRPRAPGGEPVVLLETASEAAEAEAIAHTIEELLGGMSLDRLRARRAPATAPATGATFADIAVLYRTHAQAPALAAALDRAGVPYQRVSTPPDEREPYDPRGERVALMSLHAAKGLEFAIVFIAGCEDGLLPYRRPGEPEATDPEEERRLLYVGMTRARERLLLSFARRRTLYGERREGTPSPFLEPVSHTTILRRRAPTPPTRPATGQLALFP